MEIISLDSLNENAVYSGNLYIDSTLLLLPGTVPVSKQIIDMLKKWEFSTINHDGDAKPAAAHKEHTNSTAAVETTEEVSLNDIGSDGTKTVQQELGGSVKEAIANSKKINLGDSEQSRLDMVEKVYREYANYIESLYTHYSTHKEINQEELADTIQELCIFVKDNKRYILRIISTTQLPDKNFLVTHSLKTSILSISIALQLHMTLSKMIELGTACILHEIGMLRLPPQIYMGTKQLTPGEKAQITKHTVLGYSIMKELEFPLVVQLATLEHHEKENGTGYPRKLTGDKISPIAKIISVACSYEAITSARNYKAERSTFEAMVEMLQNKNHAYDDSVIKALLLTVSLYPIGTYVYLKNRKVAVVTDTISGEPKCPIVQLLTEKNKDGTPIIVQTNTPETAILRVLSKAEQEDVLKIINEKYKLIEEAQKLAESPVSEKEKPKSASSSVSPSEAQPASENSDSSSETVDVDISFFD